MSWQIWYRYRWPAVALLVYGILLIIVAHLPGAAALRNTVFLSAVPLSLGLVFFLSVFAYPEGDVVGPHSAFPPYLLTLPVRTWELVLWPMLHGSLTAALCWFAAARWVLQPIGVEAPLLWPAALLAAMLTLLQALLWSPVGISGLRVGAAIALLPALVVAGVSAAHRGVPEPTLTAGFVGVVALAYGGAVAGLGCARRGGSPEWRWPAMGQRPRWSTRAGSLPKPLAFPSPLAAQVWFEWRSWGKVLPLAIAAVCLLLSLPFLWVRDFLPMEPNAPRSPFGSIEVNLWLRIQGSVLLLLPLLAAVIGCGRRTYDTRRKDPTLHPFLGTRPISEAGFVAARFRVAAGSTVAAGGIMVLFHAAWLLLPARLETRTAPAWVLLAPHCPPETALTLLAGLGLLLFWTWKCQVQGLWADVGGRSWIALGVPLAAHSGVLALFLAFVAWSAEPGAGDPRYRELPAYLPWAVGAALLLKGGVVLGTMAAVLRRRLAPPAALVLAAGAWGGAVLALFLTLTWISASGAPSSRLAQFVVDTYLPICSPLIPDALRSPGYLLALSALFVPLARPLLALPALAWNRRGG